MELQSLSDIFNNKTFRIPDYQRGYSWGKKQLDDLWRDIGNLNSGDIHYTGLLSVDPQEYEVVHVVDGQQRLTSLIILIHVILHCKELARKEWVCGEKKLSYQEKYLHRKTGEQGKTTKMIFGYEKDNPSHIHFKKRILEIKDTESGPPNTLYTNNLDFAKKFFVEKLADMNAVKIESVLHKITKQLEFIYYQLDEKLNQFVTFETMNYRGKDLTTLELLKNRLMYLSTKLPKSDKIEKEKLRTDINNVWKTVYEYLGRNPKRPLNDDTFLLDHWIMYFDKYGRSAAKVYKTFLLDDHFTVAAVQDGNIAYDDIRNYVLDLQKVVRAWFYLHNPQDSTYSESIKIWLGKLNRLGFRSFRPIVASVLANEVEERKVVKLLQNAENFNFVVFGINMGGRNANYKSGDIYKRTYKMHANPSKFKPSSYNARNLVGDYSRNIAFTQEDLCLYYENYFREWGALKYFFYEYELGLQRAVKKKEAKLQWEEVNGESVEHIYPQNPDKGWGKFGSKKAKSHLNYLGNLMLFPHATNAKVGNKSFDIKREVYKTCSYSAIEVAGYDDWTPETIQNRQRRMLDFLWERWEIQTPVEIDLT